MLADAGRNSVPRPCSVIGKVGCIDNEHALSLAFPAADGVSMQESLAGIRMLTPVHIDRALGVHPIDAHAHGVFGDVYDRHDRVVHQIRHGHRHAF